jgi:hypothetical protein
MILVSTDYPYLRVERHNRQGHQQRRLATTFLNLVKLS